ncbi:mucin-2-like isoform X1 [Takifugu flavidus]|uniref:mucin-2-like isoform X1 n=1 Tax=Takifugu flavidus TaxID=433684 RepID=UPI0025448F3C|nr:mucin-2-like isoform X1 [Takifugu flavidus]
MELPLGGPALRHYTQSRPRPHRQKLNYRPSRPQETIIESENEGLEFMGRVDEGVEEFFTKKVLPTDALKKQDEETITVHEVAPASSAPCPPPTKTLRRKLGDFFTLKKRRALKSEASQEGRPKKASIADFIRPLRDKERDKDKVKEHDKENEKEKGKEPPPGVTSETAVQETPASGVPPLRAEVAPPRRALREGKSQSLILLSGSAATGTTNSRNTAKKPLDGQHSFEQKLHLMLQRIGVSKAQPEETQNQEGEMKKAESEGTIIDSKPEPPPTFTKPRTMSASSDTRHQIRPSVSAHESAGKPALLPKPVLKPGPPPTTSGRNTPENELSQIEEGETNTPTKASPAAAPLATAAQTLISTTPPVVTISTSVPDSKALSSTVPPSDTDICTDSTKATTAATAATSDTDVSIKPSIPEANASGPELSTASIPTEPAGNIAPTEPPNSSAVPPYESQTASLSVPSGSTVPTPSINMLETLPAAIDENTISTTSPHLSAKPSALDSGDIVPVDVSLATDSDAIPASAVASSPATSISHMSPTSSSVPEVLGESITTTSHTSESLIPSSAKTTPLSPDAISTTTPDTPVTPSSPASSAPPVTSSTTPTATTSATAKEPMSPEPISASTATADISSPHTSSSETHPTETTHTHTSTIHADTTSTTSLETTATIKSPLSTDADPHSAANGDAALTPAISGLPSTDNTHTTAHHLRSPAPFHDSTEHDKESRASEDRDCVGPGEKSCGGEKLEDAPIKVQNENDGIKKMSGDEKQSVSENIKPAVAESEATRKEVPEKGMKLEEGLRTEVAEAASEKDGRQEEEQEPVSAHKK